uniref:Protein kinase domain-containing protein n=1 Tax=Glossina pallidipes TaxID=7398 RepID=A0A1B0AFZ1_GLOPL
MYHYHHQQHRNEMTIEIKNLFRLIFVISLHLADIRRTWSTRTRQMLQFIDFIVRGTGTFGRVCLCRDRVTNQYCAMKILAMSDVIRLKQVEHVKNEKSILSEIDHPFLLNLEWSTKDNCCLYIIFEYVCGGELFTYLRNAGRFNTETCKQPK